MISGECSGVLGLWIMCCTSISEPYFFISEKIISYFFLLLLFLFLLFCGADPSMVPVLLFKLEEPLSQTFPL